LREHALRNLQALGSEDRQTAAIHPRVGVPHAHDDPAYPGLDQSLGTGGGAAVVATGFQGDIRSGSAGIFALGVRIPKGHDLTVGVACPGMRATTDDAIVFD
jgi:hypothetical protein